MKIYFVTMNEKKITESNERIRRFVEHVEELEGVRLEIEICPVREHLDELLDTDIERIVRKKVIEAYRIVRLPCVVEHGGLFLDAWRGSPEGCDFRMISVSNDSERERKVQDFQSEFEFKKKECAALIVNLTSDPDKLMIAGFNDEEEFKSLMIDDPGSKLLVELKKGPTNENKLVKLVTANLGRSRLGLLGGIGQIVWDAIGERMCGFLRAGDTRGAEAQSVIGYCDGRHVRVYSGITKGEVTKHARGDRGFRWDPIFKPAGCNKTYGQMAPKAKRETSPDEKAWDLFFQYVKAEFLKAHQK